MIIITDTREQRPLDFSKIPARPKVEVATLETGDYSVKGLEAVVCLERKSVGDLVNTLVRSKARFAKELERMRAFKYAAIVVEGTRRDIHLHRYRSKIAPRAVEGLVNYIWVGTRIPTFWCDDEEMCAEAVYSILKQVWKKETFTALKKSWDEKKPEIYDGGH
jgi:ERCC4-type nuclease